MTTSSPVSRFDRDPREAIRTASGRLFWPLAPELDAITIDDIAHALARIARFGGHAAPAHYSVAQHSVAVSLACDASVALWALLHDASEAYLGDIPTPLKRSGHFQLYRTAESVLQSLIFERFGLVGDVPDAVLLADERLLAAEFRDLMPVRAGDQWTALAGAWPRIHPLPPPQAQLLFRQRFQDLTAVAQ